MFTFVFNLLARIFNYLFNMPGILQRILQHGEAKSPLPKPLPIEWNNGVLKTELLAHSIFAGEHDKSKEASGKPKFATGTYVGTKKAVSEVYTLINKTYASLLELSIKI